MSRVVLALVLAFVFLSQEAPDVKTGTIVGEILPSRQARVRGSVRLALLDEKYTNMYDAEALQRLDEYWETFKPTFVRSKELFYPISQVAQTEAIEYVMGKMRQEGADLLRMTGSSTPDGRFEFRNVPFGEYKVVAFGSLGADNFVWLGWVNLDTTDPVHVELKSTLP